MSASFEKSWSHQTPLAGSTSPGNRFVSLRPLVADFDILDAPVEWSWGNQAGAPGCGLVRGLDEGLEKHLCASPNKSRQLHSVVSKGHLGVISCSLGPGCSPWLYGECHTAKRTLVHNVRRTHRQASSIFGCSVAILFFVRQEGVPRPFGACDP